MGRRVVFRGPEKQSGRKNTFLRLPFSNFSYLFGYIMNTRPKRWCRRRDLAEFRGLTDRERAGYLLVLEWFENFRLRYELPAGREAAKRFWKEEVKREGREREAWQLEQCGHALQWYLK